MPSNSSKVVVGSIFLPSVRAVSKIVPLKLRLPSLLRDPSQRKIAPTVSVERNLFDVPLSSQYADQFMIISIKK